MSQTQCCLLMHTDLVLHYDAQVLLLSGVVDQGGGGQVRVLVLQLPVQS